MATKDVHSDPALFRLIGNGDEAAFGELFHQYTPLLYPAVMAIVKQQEVAREIVQEVFLTVWLKRELVAEMDNPVGWMYRVASNLAISHLRKIASHVKWLQAMPVSSEGVEPNALERISVKELQQLLQAAIHLLPPKRKMIFQLSREDGLSIEEIAGRLQMSKSTVKNQISIALKFIHEHICQHLPVYLPFCYFSFTFF